MLMVRGCDIDSEDDGICLKSSRRTCEDILVENCRVRSSCNALKFGTASFAGFKNITCRNLVIYDTYLSAIALELVDGGVMENVLISDVKITDTSNPIFIRLGHRNTDGPVGTLEQRDPQQHHGGDSEPSAIGDEQIPDCVAASLSDARHRLDHRACRDIRCAM